MEDRGPCLGWFFSKWGKKNRSSNANRSANANPTESPEKKENMDDCEQNNSLETINWFRSDWN